MSDPVTELPYLYYNGALILGLLHGSDPSHGWVLAITLKSRRGRLGVVLASAVIACGHLLSSVAVVIAIWMFKTVVLDYFRYIDLLAGGLLIAIGLYSIYRELKEHEHSRLDALSLKELFKYSLILGFAHEEEVALASMILLGANPIALALIYSGAVYVSISTWALALAEVISMGGRKRGYRLAESLSRLAPVILIAIGIYVVAESVAR